MAGFISRKERPFNPFQPKYPWDLRVLWLQYHMHLMTYADGEGESKRQKEQERERARERQGKGETWPELRAIRTDAVIA
jgi:hypothetical protein